MSTTPRSLVLFNYDWDAAAYAGLRAGFPHDTAGFDLFSFPSNARLAAFDLDRFVGRLAAAAPRRGWKAVVSNHEQFGALAAAMLAERAGWPGTPVEAVLACQHKLHARRVLEAVCPEASLRYAPLEAAYGGPIPEGLDYPLFVKPVKAAFSVLARTVNSRADLHRHTRFGAWELWVIRHLVEPFERVARRRLADAGSAHRMMLEEPVHARQYNLDGYVWNGAVHALGCVDAIMYPGTQSFMRFDLPSRLDAGVRARALEVARRFLAAIGYTHGAFNMEFFHDDASDRLTVIEFNPRLASQFGDLYRRVDGRDPHALTLWLAHGRDPAALPRATPAYGAASSLVYRTFPGTAAPPMPSRAQVAQLKARFADAVLFTFPKSPAQVARDHKWLGSYRHGILHLGGQDAADLRARAEEASRILGWVPPYGAYHRQSDAGVPAGVPVIA
ncbi:MAG: ATP-grasp domain-containing protein [Burkholderiales bacterium]|nr:ATP-grasp domain-containing protein [Burkholderiales bacterium]